MQTALEGLCLVEVLRRGGGVVVDYRIHANSTVALWVHLRICLSGDGHVAECEEVERALVKGDSQSLEVAGDGARINVKKQWTRQVGTVGPGGLVGGHNVIVLILAGRVVRKAPIKDFGITSDGRADGSNASWIEPNEIEYGRDILRKQREAGSLCSE